MKTVLITGGSGGIGRETALTFGKAGYRVCIHYNKNAEIAEETAGQLRDMGIDAKTFYADLTVPSHIDGMFSEIEKFCGGTDVLINNAGKALIKQINYTSAEEWDELFAINTRAQFLCIKAALKHMLKKKQGRIINIGSMWGETGASCEAAYSASKAAVTGLTKALAKELAPSGITVNCIAPGIIDTAMNASLSKEDMASLIGATPAGRIGTPCDIARTALFLAAEESDFITGQVLTCDGGFTL